MDNATATAQDEGGAFLVAHRSSDVVRLGASLPQTARSTKLLPCPFTGCVDARRNVALDALEATRDTLVRHLGRSQVSAGHAIPLDEIGYFVCAPN